MIGSADLGLNLNSLNESVASSMSNTFQDLYSYSNLNSASSLSWADDVSLVTCTLTTEHLYLYLANKPDFFSQEVENYATMKVQHYLDNLEEYLLTGNPPEEKCFNQSEAQQWLQLVVHFK